MLEINYFARIVARRARIVSVIACIVGPRIRTVRPKFADTNFCQSFVTMTPFSCVLMGQLVFLRKLFANGDRRPRTDIQVELPHFSNRDLYVRALIFAQMTMQKHERELLLAIPMRAL